MSFWYLVKYAKMGLKIRVHSHFGPKSLARVLLRWWWVKCAYLGGSSSSSSVAWSPSSASCLWSSVTGDAAVLACGEAVAAVSSKLLPEAVAWCGCAGCWVAVAISESASYSSQRRRFSHWFTLLHSIFCHSVLRAFMLCYFFLSVLFEFHLTPLTLLKCQPPWVKLLCIPSETIREKVKINCLIYKRERCRCKIVLCGKCLSLFAFASVYYYWWMYTKGTLGNNQNMTCKENSFKACITFQLYASFYKCIFTLLG